MPDRSERMERMARLFESLKPEIRHDMTLIPRPYIVEFDGMPSSGKTTLIKECDKYFRHHGWRVLPPQEGAEIFRYVPRSSLAEYNIRTALYCLQTIMDASWTHTHDLVLLDRGIFDCFCWIDYLHERGHITPHEAQTLKCFYQLPFFTQKIDCALVVVCDAAAAFGRETENELPGDPRGFTSYESLRRFYAQSMRLYETYAAPLYPQLQLLDTTHLTRQEMTENALDIILAVLSRRLKEGTSLGPSLK